MNILERLLPYILAVSVVFAIAACGWRLGVNQTDAQWAAKWNKQAADLEAARADVERIQRNEEHRRQAEIEGVREDAQKQIQQAAADAAIARSAADSLRQQSQRLAARASQTCVNPSPAIRGKAATSTSGLLAELFSEAAAEAADMAAAYDRARAAGAACERAYDAVRGQ